MKKSVKAFSHCSYTKFLLLLNVQKYDISFKQILSPYYMKIAIVGGGAAGFFLAIHLKQAVPENRVIIFERAGRVLAKVRVSVVAGVI